MPRSSYDEITLTPAQERRRKAIERKLLKTLDELRELATEISGDRNPDLFFEADGFLPSGSCCRGFFRSECITW